MNYFDEINVRYTFDLYITVTQFGKLKDAVSRYFNENLGGFDRERSIIDDSEKFLYVTQPDDIYFSSNLVEDGRVFVSIIDKKEKKNLNDDFTVTKEILTSILNKYKSKKISSISGAVNGAYVSSNNEVRLDQNNYLPIVLSLNPRKPFKDENMSFDISFKMGFRELFYKTVDMSPLTAKGEKSEHAISVGITISEIDDEKKHDIPELFKLMKEMTLIKQLELEAEYLEKILFSS